MVPTHPIDVPTLTLDAAGPGVSLGLTKKKIFFLLDLVKIDHVGGHPPLGRVHPQVVPPWAPPPWPVGGLDGWYLDQGCLGVGGRAWGRGTDVSGTRPP